MKILAFDTSTSACTVALQSGDLVRVRHQIAPMQQAHLILPMIDELLSSFSLAANELDAIAYGCGPGSFTGIRISSSVAQGIGFAIKKPIIPVSSLATLAQTAFLEQQWTKLLVAMDARMGKIYWASYSISPSGVAALIGEEQIVTVNPAEEGAVVARSVFCDEAIQLLINHDKSWIASSQKTLLATTAPSSAGVSTDIYGIGDGWGMHNETLVKRLGYRPIAILAAQLPSAKALLQLAQVKLEQGEWVAASQAVPVYLART